ncbi:MAG: PTS sugar transporter subunit IIA, partial [Planctomycetota bacterium]
EKDKLTREAACSVLRLKTPIEQIHDVFNVVRRGNEGKPDIFKYLSPESIETKITIPKKEDLFRHATERLARHYQDEISPVIINTALWEREQMQVTSVGKGVAMPHATLSRAPSGSSTIAVFTLEKEIDFGGPNNSKVDVCFFTMGPPSDRQAHLEILSELAKIALNDDCLKAIRSAQTPDELYQTIKRFTGSD